MTTKKKGVHPKRKKISFRLEIYFSIFLENSRVCLEIIVIIFWKRLSSSLSQLCLVPGLGLFVNGELWRLKSRSLNKVKSIVSRQLACQPEERLLKVVVGLGRDIVVLEVLLSVEGNLLGLNLTVLDFDLVSGEDNRDILADTSKITMPVGDILVGNTGGHIEHNDGALSLDVITVTKTTEFFLSSSIPNVELDWTAVSVEGQRVHFHA
mmetsp:Transcript_16613/g.23415  ORF Transcript_16613/g.23415 Transcript_16613/m.23415 type:complete len:209 (+) Transcript_16613:187-813(+)